LKYPLASLDGTIESALFGYVYPDGVISRPIQIDAATITTLPVHFQLCKHGDYISKLVKRFEDASHDGPASTALETGRGILAIYTLIYPFSYPLTGRVLGLTGIFAYEAVTAYAVLELAKACWNAEIKDDIAPDRPWLELASELLEVAERMFMVLGPEDGAQTRSSALETVDHLKGLITLEWIH